MSRVFSVFWTRSILILLMLGLGPSYGIARSSNTAFEKLRLLGQEIESYALESNPTFPQAYGHFLHTLKTNNEHAYLGPKLMPLRNFGDVDKCIVNGDAVTVEIGGNDRSGASLPAKGRLSYSFSGSTASFTADGCTAAYTR